MSPIKIANAPVSWGTLEFEGLEGQQISYQQMLDELVETGYTGTELGDWGYMPTDPQALTQELVKRDLTMLGAFVPVHLKDADAHEAGEAAALKVALLLGKVAELSGSDHTPFLVLSDDNASDPKRSKHAGRVTPEIGLTDEEWKVFASGTERIATAVKEKAGLPTVFHTHSAGYAETPDEIAHLLELTDPALIGIVFDTGHYLYGTGGSAPQAVMDGLERFDERIWYVHFKDLAPKVADLARADGWDYFEAIKHGLFCELGQGAVDFAAVVSWLEGSGYDGWAVVEQDILPGMGTPKESARRNREYLRSIGL